MKKTGLNIVLKNANGLMKIENVLSKSFVKFAKRFFMFQNLEEKPLNIVLSFVITNPKELEGAQNGNVNFVERISLLLLREDVEEFSVLINARTITFSKKVNSILGLLDVPCKDGG